MKNHHLLIGIALVGAFLVCSTPGFGVTVVGRNAETGEKADEKTEPAVRVSKSTELMEKMEDGILYTEKNQYKLSGVKVIDLAKGKKNRETLKGRKRIVELTFVEKALKEVVIHR